jgi:hypothetical protein
MCWQGVTRQENAIMSDIEDCNRYLSKIIESIQLLAADYDTQVKSLPDFVHVPDEVLLEYGDSFLLAKQVLVAGLIDASQYVRMQELCDAIDDIAVPAQYDEALAAMKSHPSWQVLRSKAADVLRALGIEKRPPDLSHITYVNTKRSQHEDQVTPD